MHDKCLIVVPMADKLLIRDILSNYLKEDKMRSEMA